MLNFDKLNSTQFEELCFDLFGALGFHDLDWRKGSGIEDASPPDQGRDIEGTYRVTEPDSSLRSEKWFFEIKHHKKGVSPDKLQGAVAWARAENVDCLVIVCSGFLSNPSKIFLEKHREQGLHIKVWENKDLERFLLPNPSIQSKYELSIDNSIISEANLSHIDFALTFHILEIEDFIDIINGMESEIRDNVFGHIYHQVIQPDCNEPSRDDQPIGECYDPPVTFDNFRDKVMSANFYRYPSQVQFWVLECLNYLKMISSESAIDRAIESKSSITAMATQVLENSETDEEKDDARKFLASIETQYGNEETIKNRIAENRSKYNTICDSLLPKLIAISGGISKRSVNLGPAAEEKVNKITEILARSDQ